MINVRIAVVQLVLLAVDVVATTYVLDGATWVSFFVAQRSVERLVEYKPFANAFVRYYHGDLLYEGEHILQYHLPMLSHPIKLMTDLGTHLVQALFMYVGGLFALLWLWLYVGSGLILKAARRFDIGFNWFNCKFDIEKKPLSSIGLVAGVLVALIYWTAAYWKVAVTEFWK